MKATLFAKHRMTRRERQLRCQARRAELDPRRWRPWVERLENRCVMSVAAPFTVGMVTLPTDPTAEVSGAIPSAGGRDLYQVTIDAQGLLVATVHSTGAHTLLSLQDAQGNVLIQSESTSNTNPDERIAQHLPAGSYELAVSDTVEKSDFSLSTSFTPSLPPGQSIVETQGADAVTAAQLTSDGKTDLIVPDYYYGQILINHGIGDGTFQPPVAIPVGMGPTEVIAAKLFSDGNMDLVVVDQLSNDLTILKGDGQGNFTVAQVLITPPGPVGVVAGDFSGYGRLDLAVAEQSSNGVQIFHNQGDGTFAASEWIGNIVSPSSLTVANLSADGKPDLAVASNQTGKITLLQGSGRDDFSMLPYQLDAGVGCSDVIAANFERSGRSQLAAVSPNSGVISIFQFDGFSYRNVATLQAGQRPKSLVAADFNGDGHLDLAAANYGSNTVSIFLGNGDDTFSAATSVSTGEGPTGIASADFNGNGSPDLVTADFNGLSVSVLINHGDATFISPPTRPPSAGPENVITADLTGNGITDLVVPDLGLNEVEVFLGRGDGTFRDPILIPAGMGPEDVVAGDFNGDGIPDLAVADYFSNTILILKGKGDGTFSPLDTLPTGSGPEYLKTADLDGDGHLDLVVANFLGNSIDVFYGRGDGTFSDPVSYAEGLGPSGVAINDLNGDGRLDIAVSDSGSNDVRVLMATGARSYAPTVSFPAGAQPWFVAAGDFNKDGHPDLVVADGLSSPSAVSVLINAGDGTYLPPVSYGVGGSPYPLAIGDFNGDGNLDIVTGNDLTNDLSVLLGNGDGGFGPEIRLPAGTDPYGVAVGDFQRNGHLDIVVVNFQSSDLTIDFGNGDGTFSGTSTIPLVSPVQPTITADLEGNGVPQVLVANPTAGTVSVFNSLGDGTLQWINTITVGGTPSGLVVGDFNGDGRPDLAVTDAENGQVLILLGLGNGTFQSPIAYKVGKSLRSPVIGDFRQDGILDIAVADTGSNQLSVLYGHGDGTFGAAVNYPTGDEPVSVIVGNANGDNYLDLGVVNRSSHNLDELFGTPGGSFVSTTINLAGITPTALVAGDFNGDGQPDLIIFDGLAGALYAKIDIAADPNGPKVPYRFTPGDYLVTSADLYHNGMSELILANTQTGLVTILGDWSNGAFRIQSSFEADVAIAGLSVADLNNDGLPDILITQAGTGTIQTYLSGGNGVFSAAESTVPLPHSAPILFPLAPGLTDIVNVNNSGQILDRTGVVGAIAQFSAPVNETNGKDISVRGSAYVETGGYPIVASLDAQRPIIYLQSTVDPTPTGVTILALPDQGVYTRLISARLFNDGLDDLIVINRTLNEILIFRQVSSGIFRQVGDPIPAGFGPTDVTTATLDPGGLPELVVADGSSGAVTVIDRDAQGGFEDEATLPAGLATAGTVLLPGGLNLTSPDQPVSITSGVFNSSGLTDVVVADHGTDRISILPGLAEGGLGAPSAAMTYSTGVSPIQVVAASLTKSGLLDLIVLNEGSHDLSIFLNNGHGGFTVMPRVDAGDSPSSIVVSDVTGNGTPDIVVSNSSGDILILAGHGDGTFQPYERADSTVNLAVGDLSGNGQNDFVLTNTAQDLLSVQTSSSSPGFLQSRGNGLLAPGPVAIADMNGDGIPDLIVTNTGGNDVLVYLGLGGGRFAPPQEFFTGTSPLGLTVAKLTTSGLPDLVVANSGSNDVTILLGTLGTDGQWTMVPGPRLKAGQNPVSTTVADVLGTGEPDIVVVNKGSNTVTILEGLGGGFFDDSDPLTLATGQSPVQAFVGHFSSSTLPGIVVLNSASNDMSFYPNDTSAPQTIASGGIDPVAGVQGDFNKDGYTDLAVADNGDSRIALFDGGAGGLVLAQTILLGASTHPTDLVVSNTPGTGLQFFVGASGQDHAISVAFSNANSSNELNIGVAPMDPVLVTSGNLGRSNSSSAFSSNAASSAIFEPPGNVVNATTTEASSTATTTSASNGAASLAAAMVTTLAAAAQPLFAPSSRAIGWLLENLVQLAQGQTAEILPVGKSEMAAVAVLLSASSVGGHVDERSTATLPVPTENETPMISPYIPDESNTMAPSRLDRFVADLDASTVDFTSEIMVRDGGVVEFGPDWVWHQRSTDPTAVTATFHDGSERTSTPWNPISTTEIAALDGLDAMVSDTTEADVADTPVSVIPGFVLSLGSVILVLAGIIGVRSLHPRWRIVSRVGGTRPTEPSSRPVKAGGPKADEARTIPSSFVHSRGKIRQDLPPWLLEPMGARHWRSLSSRTIGSVLPRKNSLHR